MMLNTVSAAVLLGATLAHAFALKGRQNGPAVGSPEWAAQYPPGFQVADPKPEWLGCLKQAEANGLIPNIPQTTVSQSGYPVYPAGYDPAASGACSWTTSHCFSDDDIHVSLPNTYTASYDDGPVVVSDTLYDFLSNNGVLATHFMIGSNILTYPTHLQAAFNAKQHLGVHTWAHKFLTTLTNEQIVGELGWTTQIIMDLTGGLIPNIYRPPDGDVDDRVRAIARECFSGMRAVFWDYDTSDWELLNPVGSTNGVTLATIDAALTVALPAAFATGIMPLHHEITADQISSFTDTFGLIKQIGYRIINIADLANIPWYLNADNANAQLAPLANPALSNSSVSNPDPSSSSTITSLSVSASDTTTIKSASSFHSSVSVSMSMSRALPSLPPSSSAPPTSAALNVNSQLTNNAFASRPSATAGLAASILIMLCVIGGLF